MQPEPIADPNAPPESAREAEWRAILTASGLTEDGRLPPQIVATPSEILRHEDVRWWRPSWRDGWQHVGWRWVFLLPTALLLLGFLRPLRWLGPVTFVWGGKLLITMIAVALALAGYVFRRAARARTEPFCIFCGYNLSGLPDAYRCPECGRPYTWRLIAEYRRDPQWFIERYAALRRLPKADAPFTAGPGPRRKRRDGT